MTQSVEDAPLTGDLPPASAAKRDAIIKAAACVFMAHGYGAASMDQIANEAGVSKQTIYSYFGAKEALFEAIVHAKCAALTGRGVAKSNESKSLDDVLYDTASSFLNVVLAPESVTLYRTILAECVRFPELASAFYRSGPRSACDRLAGYLASIKDHQTVEFRDPVASAELYFSMLRGDMYMQCILSLRGMPNDDEVAVCAREVTNAFLNAHRIIKNN